MVRALNPHPLLAVPEGELSPAAERLAREYLATLGTTGAPDAPPAPEPDAPAPAGTESADAPAPDSPTAPDSPLTAARRFSRDGGPMWLLGVFYAVMVTISVWGQTDGIIRWRHLHPLTLLDGAVHIPARGLALIPAATIELLGAVLFTFADWRRSVKFERALAVRFLALAVAAGVAVLNFIAHNDAFDQIMFVGTSVAAFAVVVAHTNARRRDAHPDQVKRTGPEYGLAQWLTAPRVTIRARQLALAVPDHLVKTSAQASRAGSLELARQQLVDEARQRAEAAAAQQSDEQIIAALGRLIGKSVDPVTRDLALASFDLGTIARQVAAAVDNEGMARLLGADLAPAQLTAQDPGEARKARDKRRRAAPEPAASTLPGAPAPAESGAAESGARTESAGESTPESGAPDSARRVHRDAPRTESRRRTRRTGAATPAASTLPGAPAGAAEPAASGAADSGGTVTKLDPEYDAKLGELLSGWAPDDGPRGDWCTEHEGCRLPSQRQAMAELKARGFRVGLSRAGKAVALAHQLDRTRPDAREATG